MDDSINQNRVEHQRLRELLRVYFIMGSGNCSKDPREVLLEAIAGGITLFQFREKGNGALTGEGKYDLAVQLRDVCRAHNVPFIVNDDIDLALATQADGVHIGQEDESIDRVREKIGNRILGVSVHTIEEAEEAIRLGADYFGVGPIYPTSTKTDAKAVQDVSFVEKLRRNGYSTPIVGIGGITAENAATVTAAGADGVSVITAITNARNIPKQVEELTQAVSRGISLAVRE